MLGCQHENKTINEISNSLTTQNAKRPCRALIGSVNKQDKRRKHQPECLTLLTKGYESCLFAAHKLKYQWNAK